MIHSPNASGSPGILHEFEGVARYIWDCFRAISLSVGIKGLASRSAHPGAARFVADTKLTTAARRATRHCPIASIIWTQRPIKYRLEGVIDSWGVVVTAHERGVPRWCMAIGPGTTHPGAAPARSGCPPPGRYGVRFVRVGTDYSGLPVVCLLHRPYRARTPRADQASYAMNSRRFSQSQAVAGICHALARWG